MAEIEPNRRTQYRKHGGNNLGELDIPDRWPNIKDRIVAILKADFPSPLNPSERDDNLLLCDATKKAQCLKCMASGLNVKLGCQSPLTSDFTGPGK